MSQTHKSEHFERRQFFAVCAPSLEPLLANELRAMRTPSVRPQRGGVLFSGTLKDAYRVCLFSRLASRVLLTLMDVPARNRDELYKAVHDFAWEEHLDSTGTLIVQTTGTTRELNNTQFTNMLVKDAVVDRMRDKFDRRPSVTTKDPDITINVLISSRGAKISLDLSGEPLHKRGYRIDGVQVVAPLRETVAAATLYIANWPEIAEAGGDLVDFMCGSGTLAIEGAMMALDIAPQLHRKHWGFSKWLGHDEEAWEKILDEGQTRAEEGRKKPLKVYASDFDARAIDIARRSIRRAQLEKYIELERSEIGRVAERTAKDAVDNSETAAKVLGLIVLNPPYGARLETTDQLSSLYQKIAALARAKYYGYDMAIISPDERIPHGLSMLPKRAEQIYNGRINAEVKVFRVGEPEDASAYANKLYVESKEGSDRAFGGKGAKVLERTYKLDTEPFKNRLIKMKKHLEKWARRAGITSYRVYDADLPDYNLAIDIYEGTIAGKDRIYLHISEYAPPANIEASLASARLEAAKKVAAEVFEIAEERIITKVRKRMRGTQQYEQQKSGPTPLYIRENELEFEVDLSSYLDTGIFLDHRDVRARLKKMSEGKDVLNLFCYTGTASVYAAAGKAKSVTSVDLSKTYILWAERNMDRNKLLSKNTHFIAEDVFAWIEEAVQESKKFDLIFCDPPTFSNSKSMDGTWDVERDHAGLIKSLEKLLTDSGVLIFSTNKRGFEIDKEAVAKAGFTLRDITAATMPKDFENNSKIHRVYELAKGSR